MGFKYRNVELTHSRYLDEPCWLAAPQLTRWFIRYVSVALFVCLKKSVVLCQKIKFITCPLVFQA